MSELVPQQSRFSAVDLYDAAVHALSQATSLIDAMSIRDRAEALRFLGRQAQDSEAVARAVELRLRAERKLGGMLIELKQQGLLNRGGRAGGKGISLTEANISRNLSSAAQKLAEYDEDRFEGVIGESLNKIRAGKAIVVNPLKDLTTEDKKLRRRIREAQLALKQQALPAGKFGVILADPEWPDEVWSEAGKDRSPENHYPLSSIEAIASRPVGDIAAADAIMLLWITMRHLAIGSHVTVLRGWGFEPRAVMIWDKMVAGTGHWVRNRCEALVIATRGNVPAPAKGTQTEDLFQALRDPVHSRKPDFAHEWIEEFYPNLRKIELNARRARPGWALWGNEAPEELPDLHDAAADPAGGDGPPVATGRSPSDAPEGAAAAGEGGGAEPAALPHAGITPEDLSNAQKNDIIRAAYALDPFPGGAVISGLTGLSRDAVKQRARTMKLGNPARQRAAASKAMTRLNQEREQA